ncbi:MAG: hypothetical protein RLZZ123_2366 [Pseudomonadota bacterium]
MRTATGGLATMRPHSWATASVNSASGTTRLIKPWRSASWASIKSPVSNISIAFLRLTLRDRPTPGVAQNRP